MSRTQAAGKWRKVSEERTRPDGTTYMFKGRERDPETAAVNWPEVRAKLAKDGITVLGSGADEAPEVYKDLASVLAAHSNIEIIHTLRPVGVVMAGADVRDPYKD
jgi:tRNA-splicing ligase RtcB